MLVRVGYEKEEDEIFIDAFSSFGIIMANGHKKG